TLDNLTLGANLSINGGFFASGTVTVPNTLTLTNNATLSLASNGTSASDVFLNFSGTSASLAGTGTVVFVSGGAETVKPTGLAGSVLTLGSGITVHGANGTVGS